MGRTATPPIGADGRATDEAFWVATQHHALRKWRFRPAIRDCVAVGGSKALTVHFRLTDR